MPGWVTEVLDIIRASPNLEALTLLGGSRLSIKDIAAMVQVLCVHTNLHSLTIGRFYMNSNCAAAFAAAFQANQTIKTLIMGWRAIERDARVSFVEVLPRDHSLETIIFDKNQLDDNSAVTIVRTLCHKHIKNLSLVDKSISRDGCDRIIQILKENKHSFVKLELFPDDADYLWQNKIRLEMEELTWNNYLQVEKDKWLDQFLGQDARTKELLFRALERAKKLDNERFSKAPNMLFHLIKELPGVIAQAIHH
jgi:Ran GTPase-activating protein (RanGAP) involved in mRNA processing and transport